jgi:aminopeptidase N
MKSNLRPAWVVPAFALSTVLAGCTNDDSFVPIFPAGAGGTAGAGGAAGAAGVGGSTGVGGTAGAGGGPAGRTYDALSYELRGTFDWASRRLVASETITLDLGDAPGPDAVELDAAVDVKRVHAGGSDLPFSLDVEAHKLRVDLSSFGTTPGARSFDVDYEASPSIGLIAYQGRDDDPVAARMVATDSEPTDGMNWLVAHHHPSDRALFKVELTVDPDEDLVANGERVLDELSGGKRRVRYEMAQPLPTYVMAFAAGQIEHHERTGGRVPLGLWHRRGLPVDAERHLELIAGLMATFETRLGPYPWGRYSVVLAPGPFGMENATITFNSESSGQGELDVTLNAHELAHQWFGDWVTMRDYDDAWFKEGMATLLEIEAQRAGLDLENRGRLFGRSFRFNPEDSIVDRGLVGDAKYNSGIYDRAAWLITQIRAKVGEEAFWGALRKALADHALGDLDGEGFVRSFAPALDEATIQKALATLEQKPTPELSTEIAYLQESTSIKLALSDPSGALLSPLEVTVVDAAGQATKHAIEPGVPLEVLVPSGGYLAPDEGDVHPVWRDAFIKDPPLYYDLATLFWPYAEPALSALLARSAAHQEVAFDAGRPPALAPEGFGALYAGLDSRQARASAELQGCYAVAFEPEPGVAAAWAAAIAPALSQPAVASFSFGRSYCGAAIVEQLRPEFVQTAGALTAANAGRFSYLLGFDYGVATIFDVASQVATSAPSLQLRERALSRLVAQIEAASSYTGVPAEQAPPWKAFFRERLAQATSATRFDLVWRGVRGLSDEAALVTAAQKLHAIALSDDARRAVVCDAFAIAEGHEGAFDAFRAAAQPWAELGPGAAAALADPSVCTPAPEVAAPSRARHAPEASRHKPEAARPAPEGVRPAPEAAR